MNDTEIKYYILTEDPTYKDLESLGLKQENVNWRAPFYPGIIGLVAIRTGEIRNPLGGEWYLSGSIPAAWFARKDIVGLRNAYPILKLVTVKTTITTTIINDGSSCGQYCDKCDTKFNFDKIQ